MTKGRRGELHVIFFTLISYLYQME